MAEEVSEGCRFVSQSVQDAVSAMQQFSSLATRDASRRKITLDSLDVLLDQCLDGYGSPPIPPPAVWPKGQERASSYLQALMPSLLRLSLTCPFEDVRQRLDTLLNQVKERGCGRLQVPVVTVSGPSHFIPADEVVPADTTVEDNQSVFMEAFLQNNRLEHISQVMGYHPDYLRNFLTTQNFLLREDGPLPYEYRHYIAIMAAARHHCTYLVKLHEQDFLLHNGDPQWLKGIAHAPRKLQDLYEVNKILAHQPWLITKQHIHNLLKSPEPWSLSELMQAIILLTHFHSLCSFVYGCGINPELDMQGFSLTQPASPATDSDSSEANSDTGDTINVCGDEESVGLEALLARMRQLDAISSANTTSPEELLKRFHSVEHQNAEITVPSGKNNSPRAEILRFVQDPEFSYIDFASRDSVSEVATFRACDYSWDDHGFSLANRLYLDVGTLLDDKYNLAANLTYYTMGDNREVDTSSFRRAIWNYIHCMYGIRHDDYDYSEVNQLLERNLKGYIKTLTCYPERLTKKDYDGVMREFKHSEKVHVNLMLMEARQQAELLYALRALNRYMT